MTDAPDEIHSWQIPRTDAERAALRKVFERDALALQAECWRQAVRQGRHLSHYRTGLGR